MDRSRDPRRTGGRVLALFVIAALVLPIGSASAADAVVRRGACTRTSRWRLAMATDAQVLRVRLAVRGGRAGQRWNVFMDHNETLAFAGSRVSGTDGFWVVRRRLRNLRGSDTISFGAHNVVTGETCSGRASL